MGWWSTQGPLETSKHLLKDENNLQSTSTT